MFFQKAFDGRNRWWRWLLTIIVVIAVLILSNIPLIAFLGMEAQKLGFDPNQLDLGSPPEGIDRNLIFALFLTPFVAGFLVLWFCVRLIHAKPWLSVLTGRPRFDWSRAAIGFAVWFVLLGAGSFALLPAGSLTFRFEPSTFWPLLVIALALIPIQGSFEEIFFRGYLMQGVALLARNKIVPLILVTVLFAGAHIGNPEFNGDQWRIGLSYLLVAALFGLTAVLDDGLEVPCGIHAANNIFGAVFLRPDVNSTFFTDALFTAPFADLVSLSPYLDLATIVIAFAIFYRIFGWRFSDLTGPVAPMQPADAGPPPSELPSLELSQK